MESKHNKGLMEFIQKTACDGAYAINPDEETQRIALYVNGDNVTFWKL